MPSTATWRPPGVDEENGTVISCSPLLGVRPKRIVFKANTKDESEPASIDVPVAYGMAKPPRVTLPVPVVSNVTSANEVPRAPTVEV